MDGPPTFKLLHNEKIPRRHGAALDLLFGGVIVRVEYDAGEGRLGFAYRDDDTVLTRTVKHDKLKHAKVTDVCGKLGLLMNEVVGGLANDPKGLFMELPKRMKRILDGNTQGETDKEDKAGE
jgi:hypothetical protein